ncbi:MAG: methionine--tRNA ligase [Candidatus Aenigmatarchaeota archaeon]
MIIFNDEIGVKKEESERILITSALPYIHGIPHLGNIIGSVLPADVYYRFQRLRGKNVIYICGSDSHGTMYEIEAQKRGVETGDLVYENHQNIMKLFEKLDLDFSYYGITNSEENKEITNEIFQKLDENGYIKEREIDVTYCKNCDKFLADRWIEGECPECGGLARGDQCDDCGALLSPQDLIEPYCVHCGKNEIEFRKSDHLFFQLQEFEDWLKEWIKGRTGNKLTNNETFSWLDNGLEERCISRDSEWGFKIPKKGYENKVFYVWFDAPIGYIGATVNWARENDENWKDWWVDENTKLIQFMGKDNIPFHTVIFPSVLKGTEENWTFANKIMASGFLMSEGVKFSKSRGKGLNIENALKIRDSDYWRFILTSLYPENSDTKFSWEIFMDKINNELVDSFGNFIHRVLKFTSSNFDEVPKIDLKREDEEFLESVKGKIDEIESSMKSFKFRRAINEIIKISSMGNKYFQKKKPWETLKEDKEECKRTLYVCCNIVRSLAILTEPFMPETSEKMWSLLNQDTDIHAEDWDKAKEFDLSGARLNDPEPLFEKVEEDEIPDFENNKDEDVKDGGEKMISFEDFKDLDLRVGQIEDVEQIEGSNKLVKLKINVGGEVKQSVAGVKNYYSEEELKGKKVTVLVNLEPAELMGEKSECMVLAADIDGEPILLQPEKDVDVGAKIR